MVILNYILTVKYINDQGKCMNDKNFDFLIRQSRRIYQAFDDVDEIISQRLNINRSDLRALNTLENGLLPPTKL